MSLTHLRSHSTHRTEMIAVGCGLLLVLLQQPLAWAQNNGGPSSQTSYFFVLGEGAGPGGQHTDSGTTSAISKSYDMNGASGYASGAVTSGSAAPDLHAVANVAAGSNIGATGQASFTDNLDLSVNSTATLPATLKLDYFVTGSLSGNANGRLDVQWGDAHMSFSLGNGAQAFQVVVSSSDLTSTGSYYFDGAITETLMANANNTTGAASADFGDTVKLGEVEAYDANGNPIAAQLFDTYNDGTHGPLSFPANTNLLVPEPSTWVLLLAGSAGMFALLRRRRRRAA